VIDALAVARILHEEARLRAGQRGGPSFEDHPLPEPERIARVIEEMFWASLLSEEGRPCRPRLLYTTESDRRAGHWFEDVVPLTRQALRMLAPTQGQRGYLSWTFGPKGPVITGVHDHCDGDFVLTAPGAGALDAAWAAHRILSVRAGELRRLSTCALPDARSVFAAVQDAIGGMPSLLVRALLAIVDDAHGGSLWLVSEARAKQARLEGGIPGVRMGHRVRGDDTSPAERFGDDEEARLRWVGSVAHLAAVDGAVVVDASARVLGFSAFVETGPPVPLIELLPDGETRRISSPDTGGGRHRSAAEFCRRAAPAAALVVSADGRISLFACRRPGQPPFFSEVMALGAAV
jgi:hypothetical protein